MKAFCGQAQTCDEFLDHTGINYLEAANSPTLDEVNGGELTTEGDFAIQTLEVNDRGIVFPNNVPSVGDAVVTASLNGGTVDAQSSNRARTWATVNQRPGAVLKADSDVLSITNWHVTGGRYTITAA